MPGKKKRPPFGSLTLSGNTLLVGQQVATLAKKYHGEQSTAKQKRIERLIAEHNIKPEDRGYFGMCCLRFGVFRWNGFVIDARLPKLEVVK